MSQDDSKVFVTESATRQRPKLSGKAAFRAALRGSDPEALREAIKVFKSSPQYDEAEIVSFSFSMKPF